ncbi:hypothetical protein [uncultured Roseovarius sp.]|uniref:hypothetical protein n=1 Tax=Roseovarius sp. TaxID=1486281 RepID=UPI0025E31830|nr:hypothetical protein [uncultured Roseovarius sp.]
MIIGLILLLGACAQVKRVFAPKAEVPPPQSTTTEPGSGSESTPRPPAGGPQTAAAFDTTTPQERAEAAAVAAKPAARDLGVTIASLGAPTEPGFWLKTPLVSAAAEGRVDYPANGKSVAVDLIPLDGPEGAGSRMSLAAFRLLEAPLTGLPEVRVHLLAE